MVADRELLSVVASKLFGLRTHFICLKIIKNPKSFYLCRFYQYLPCQKLKPRKILNIYLLIKTQLNICSMNNIFMKNVFSKTNQKLGRMALFYIFINLFKVYFKRQLNFISAFAFNLLIYCFAIYHTIPNIHITIYIHT